MRTAKRLTILLTVALACITPLGAGQSNAPQMTKEPSNTRDAECLVRITADAGIVPLNRETIPAILYSPAVLGRTAKEILGPDAPQDPSKLITFKWMPEAGPYGNTRTSELPPENAGAYNDEMMRQLESIYGEEYRKTMMGSQEEPDSKRDSAGDSKKDERNAPDKRRQEGSAPGANEGAAGDSGMRGGMMGGGMMGGGMMGSGVMGGGTIDTGRLYGGYLPNSPYGPLPGRTMGGMGMGGGFGGMGGGMGGFYGAPNNPETVRTIEQRATILLSVTLPDGTKPVAREFLNGLVDNLRLSLTAAHSVYADDLRALLSSLNSQRTDAEKNLLGTGAEMSPSERTVREQLDQIVDLSALNPQTPLAEALEVLKNAVVPSLQIIALWNNLTEANVEPTNPINIDGMSSVRLGVALDLLLKGISSGSPVVYRIKENVIVIGTPPALRASAEPAAKSTEQIDVRALAAQKNELARTIQSLELGLASMEARRKAISIQMEEIRREADLQLAKDTVTQELEKLVQISTTNLDTLQKLVKAGQVSQTDLASAQGDVARARIELARRREELSKLTGGSRLEQYNSELSEIAIDEAENRARLEILRQQLNETQRQLAQASTFDPEAARARIAQETLDILNRRIAEIQTRLAGLALPTVALIAAN